MPISKDRFVEIQDRHEGDPTPETNAAQILEFLREHPNEAFRQSEITDKTEVKSGSVGPTLVRLRERGRVDHHAKYWAISDQDRAVGTSTALASSTLSSREDEDETPEMSEWEDHAVDPREYRNAE